MSYAFKLFEFNVYNGNGNKESSDDDDDYSKAKTDNTNFVIQMFGINEKGEKASIIV